MISISQRDYLKVRLISRTEVEGLISIGETIEAVEQAFKSKGVDGAQMPPKSYIFFKEFKGDFRVMPAYLEDLGAAGVKIVNVHPQNPKNRNLPSVMATIVILSPETGAPLAIMDGTSITDLRTGAAGAVAAKYLAREDSSLIGMIGAGAQARTQLSALNEIFGLAEVKAYSRASDREKFASDMSELLGIDVGAVEEPEEAVKGMDIVTTTTPARSPIVFDEWISEGTHINAIGADAPGKEELDPKILERAKIVIDEWEQASHGGEINVPISEGRLTRDDIYADICSIVAGKREGRTSEEGVTVFDSTGLAVQDIATAWRVYQKAEKERVGKKVELL